MTNIDPEEHHEREEVDIEALIRKIEGEAQLDREAQDECPQKAGLGERDGSPGAPFTRS